MYPSPWLTTMVSSAWAAAVSCKNWRSSSILESISVVAGMPPPSSSAPSPSGPRGESSVLTMAVLLKLWTILIHFSWSMVDME